MRDSNAKGLHMTSGNWSFAQEARINFDGVLLRFCKIQHRYHKCKVLSASL